MNQISRRYPLGKRCPQSEFSGPNPAKFGTEHLSEYGHYLRSDRSFYLRSFSIYFQSRTKEFHSSHKKWITTGIYFKLYLDMCLDSGWRMIQELVKCRQIQKSCQLKMQQYLLKTHNDFDPILYLKCSIRNLLKLLEDV